MFGVPPGITPGQYIISGGTVMPDKIFWGVHGKKMAPMPLTGKTWDDALARLGLNPATWEEVPPQDPDEETPPGDNL